MKKRKALFLTFLSTIALGTIVLTGCTPDKNNNLGGSQQQTIILSSEEETIYRAVANSLSSFKNPSSVTVIAVSKTPLIGGRYVKISGQNGFGGSTTSIFQVSGSSLRGPIDDITFYADGSISVASINQKLNQYKQSMGW